MATISLCMIVKNEEAVLERCLMSVRDATDEMIIVDTGSTDKTKEIARKFTDRVYDFPWIDDFSAARNFAYGKAGMEYQMWLDADDVLPAEECRKLIALKETLDPAVDMVTMKYHTHFDAYDQPILTSTRERLTKTSKHYRWQDPVHECIPLSGNIEYSDIVVHHRKIKTDAAPSRRNIAIYEAYEKSGHIFTPRQTYYFARELKDHGEWERAVCYFENFLKGQRGWGEDNIAACLELARCYGALGEPEKQKETLLKSFSYAPPRAEICCELGYWYQAKQEFANAIAWFQVAANMERTQSIGFVSADYYGFIPNIECCVCYSFLGEYDKAWEYNEKAAVYKPNDEAVAQNRRFLQNKK